MQRNGERGLPCKIGLVTTWNQDCGLATYAKFLASEFDPKDIVIFSERAPLSQGETDDHNVIRCWNRESAQFSELKEAVLTSGVELLHFNAHDHNFFALSQLKPILVALRENGIALVVSYHTTYSIDPAMTEFNELFDRVIVHTKDNAAQVMANGCPEDKLRIIPHGVRIGERSYSHDEQKKARVRLDIPEQAKVLVSFGFVQPNKGIEGLIEAVAYLRAKGVNALGYVVGKVNRGHPTAIEYFERLKQFCSELGVSEFVVFTDSFVEQSVVEDYMLSSDATVFNYHSEYFESSGACSIAIGMGVPVIASLAPAFLAFDDAVWRVTAGFPLSLSAEVVLFNEELRSFLLRRSAEYRERYSWNQVAGEFAEVYREFDFSVSADGDIAAHDDTVTHEDSERRERELDAIAAVIDRFEVQDFAGAKELLDSELSVNGNIASFWTAKAIACFELGEWSEALAAIEESCTRGGEVSELRRLLFDISCLAPLPTLSARALEGLYQQEDDFLPAYANFLIRTGEYEAAKELLSETSVEWMSLESMQAQLQPN